MNNDKLKQYVWLVNLLMANAKDGLTLKEIEEACDGRLPRQTFVDWIKTIKIRFGLEIVCGDHYRYKIKNPEVIEDSSANKWLMENYSVPDLFSNKLRDRISMDTMSVGTANMSLIASAMEDNCELCFDYQKYESGSCAKRNLHVHPYALKAYNRRWYMLCKVEEWNQDIMYHLALDRILGFITKLNKHFELPIDFNADKYYKDIVGISIDPKEECKDFKIKAYGDWVNYMRYPKFHPSQEEVKTVSTGESPYSIFTYRMKKNPELIAQLLSMGDKIEVLEPKELRDGIRQALESNLKRYQNEEV